MPAVVGSPESNGLGIVLGCGLRILDIFGGKKVEISHTVEEFHQDVLLTCEDLVDSVFVEEVVFEGREVGQFLPHQQHSDAQVSRTGNSYEVVALGAQQIEDVGVLSLHFLEHQLRLVVIHVSLLVLYGYGEVEVGVGVVLGFQHEADGQAFLLAVDELHGQWHEGGEVERCG